MFKKEKNGKTNTKITSKEVMMVLVLLFCTILIVITIIFFLVILSTLKIEVKNYEVSNMYSNQNNSEKNLNANKNTCKNNKINAKYKIKVSLNVLDKLRILQLKLNSEKIKKITLKMHLDRIDIKKLEKEIRIDDIKEIMQVKPKISYLDLSVKVGIDDVLLTTYAVPLICTAISALLPLAVEKKNYNKIKYVVKPIYNNGNVYDLKFNIGIKIKVIKFLNAVYRIYKNKKTSHSKNVTPKSKVNEKTVKCNV